MKACIEDREKINYIKNVKTMHGVTLKEIAKRIGVSSSYLSQIIHGKKKGSLMLMVNIRDKFNMGEDSIVKLVHTEISPNKKITFDLDKITGDKRTLLYYLYKEDFTKKQLKKMLSIAEEKGFLYE